MIGSAHPADHGFLRRDGRVGFLVRDRGDGALARVRVRLGRSGGWGRCSPSTRRSTRRSSASPSARRPPLGPVALWVPGTADVATRALLDAGLRLDGFPGLVCWSRPDHPFDRYLPISLALV